MRSRGALLAVALLLAGCSGEGVGSEATGPPRASTTTTAPVVLAPSSPYVAVPSEIELDLKGAAVATVQALMTYDAQNSSTDAARRRLVAAAAPPQIADKAGAVLIEGAQSAADVVYPQLGGLTSDRASVMVVIRQRLLQGRDLQAFVRTVDVRLVRHDGRWTVEDIPSFGGDAPASPVELSVTAREVLAHPAIDLPDSARWDISSGRVGEPVLALLVDLARTHKLGVTVFASGHPREVFGTTRVSNHTRGAAVDLWLVDTPIVAQRGPNGSLPALVGDLLKRGVTELGAPFAVDGPGGGSFTDTVHQDHLHLAFR